MCALPDDNNEKRTRIDLLNYDKNSKKIVAIELKMLLDKRLYDGEIKTQLKNYISFLNRNENAIKQAYENAKEVKIALGLISNNSMLAQIDYNNIKIEQKPLLVVGCYGQKLIDKFKDEITNEVKDCALGVFFFGSTGGDLNLPIKRDKNKIIFNQ